MVVAVARSGVDAVGIDIEPPAGDMSDLRRWVRTEAVLKATGDGLDVDPSLVEVGARGSALRVVRWDGPGRRPVMRVIDLELGAGLVAALAYAGRRRAEVRVHDGVGRLEAVVESSSPRCLSGPKTSGWLPTFRADDSHPT